MRPRDDGSGWVVDVYDGRGHWERTIFADDGKPMKLKQAQNRARRLRCRIYREGLAI